jgi:hypothetical protein
MADLSVRAAIHNRYPWANLAQGVLASTQHVAYQGHRDTFPYKSLRDWLHSLEWPPVSAYDYLGDYPADSAPGWTNNVQGVTTSATHWFFSAETEGLWKLPLSRDLDADIDDGQFPHANVPPPYSGVDSPHMGDLDHFDGLLFVPFEGTHPRRIMLFRASDLKFLDTAPVAEQSDCPWCAVNPRNRLLYSSHFDTDHLNVYRMTLIANSTDGVVGLGLEFLYNFELRNSQGARLPVSRVQGGAFSPSGHFYLVSDVDNGGLMGFDMTTGRRMFQRTKASLPTDVEMEGLTIFDADAAPTPHIGGQIHIVWLQDEAVVDDDIYFSHFRVAAEHRHKL